MSFPSFSEDIFSTNRAVTDVEGEQIAHLLADYENKIALLTKKIADLDAERAVLQSAATPLRQALSPFRRLPYDVIREIFIACLDPHAQSYYVVQGGTCSSYSHLERHALCRTPTPPSSGRRFTSPSSDTAKEASHNGRPPEFRSCPHARGASRSGFSGVLVPCPLSISVHELPHPYLNQLLWSNPLADKILIILLKCCARWRDVSFAMLSTSQCQLASVKPEQVPLIRSITIRSPISSAVY